MTRLLQISCALVVLAVLLIVGAAPGSAQSPTPSASTAPSASPSPTATPVPLPFVVTQSEAVLRSLRDIQADLDSDQVTAQVERGLPELTAEITEQLAESRAILDKAPSLDALRSLQADWDELGNAFPLWTRELTSRATQLDTDMIHLGDLEETWQKTMASAKATDTPSEVLQRIESAIISIVKMRVQVEARRGQVLALQSKVAAQAARVNEALSTLRKTRAEAVTLLFVQDSPYIWQIRAHGDDGLMRELADAWAVQTGALESYVRRQPGRFVLHGVVIGVFALLLMWARDRMRPQAAEEPHLQGVMRVFEVPFSTAVLLSLTVLSDLYPRSPRLLEAILAGAALVPSVRLLRQLLEPALFPVLNVLIAFYVTDLGRHLFITVPVLHRLVFLAEMLFALAFLVWLVRTARTNAVEEPHAAVMWRGVLIAARVYQIGFLVSVLANLLGYWNLSRLVGNAFLDSAYAGLILFGVQRVLEGLAIFTTRVWPLNTLAIINNHRPKMRARIHSILSLLTSLLWIASTLEMLSLNQSVGDWLEYVLNASARVGSVQISLGSVLAFCIAVWAAFALSRFISFVLDEDVYPRVPLARGVPYAISTMLHYVILLVGFFIALAALGIDMTKFTILAGAFGVGLGFGLQNVVNNFVSGLILLFERPVNVGDVVELRNYTGDLQRIGLRASVVRTPEGSEVIVPNGQLISQEVVNWTLSDQRRRFEINIGVDYDADPEKVIALMLGVARAHSDVLEEPAPQAILTTFGDNAINFQMRVWTSKYDGWMVLRSDLNVRLLKALREAGIGIPFPQLDLHVKPPQ